MSFYGNDFGNQKELLTKTSPESLDARSATPTDQARRHRSAGWWPSGGSVLKVALVAVLVIVSIGWALTLLS